jgi:hypothetical protein
MPRIESASFITIRVHEAWVEIKLYIIYFSITSIKSWRQSLEPISQNHIDNINIIDLREKNLREIYSLIIVI